VSSAARAQVRTTQRMHASASRPATMRWRRPAAAASRPEPGQRATEAWASRKRWKKKHPRRSGPPHRRSHTRSTGRRRNLGTGRVYFIWCCSTAIPSERPSSDGEGHHRRPAQHLRSEQRRRSGGGGVVAVQPPSGAGKPGEAQCPREEGRDRLPRAEGDCQRHRTPGPRRQRRTTAQDQHPCGEQARVGHALGEPFRQPEGRRPQDEQDGRDLRPAHARAPAGFQRSSSRRPTPGGTQTR
jgi:hypothetical protein